MRLRGKAILIAAGIAAVSVPFSIGAMRAQTPSRTSQTPSIVGDYFAVVTPPGRSEPTEEPQTQSRPAAPTNAVRPAGTPKWEAVSIRPCPTPATGGGGERGRGGGGPVTGLRFSSDRMTLNCLSVRSLIRSAYHIYLELVLPGNSLPMDAVLISGLPFVRNGKNPTDGTVGGPDWIDNDGYTIEAKAEGVTDRSLMQGPMLQAILEDRFKIKVHRETREMAVDALVIARGGSKLKPFVEGSCVRRPGGRDSAPLSVWLHIKADANGKLSGTMEGQGGQSMPLSNFRVEGQALSFSGPDGGVWKGSIEDNGARLNGAFTGGPNSMPLVLTRETAQTVRPQRYCRIEGGGLSGQSVNLVYDAEGFTIDEFVKVFLRGYRGRFVIDKTGLTGKKFDIHLETEIGPEIRQRPAFADVQFGPSTVPPLPDALQQQLGLRLESTKGPVELLVIDRIERPSPN